MSVKNPVLELSGKAAKKEHFTLLQAIALLVITAVFFTGGWYVAGQKYFWSDLDKKRLNEQVVFLQQKVQTEPKDMGYRVALGYTYFLLAKNEKAIKELNQVIEMDKNNFDGYYNLGLVYSDEERFDDAMEMFQKAIKLSPQDYKGYVQQGIVYRKMRMYDDAFKTLEKATKLAPGNADVIYHTGLVAETQGDKKTAIVLYKEALRFDPLYKDAAKGLERLK